MKICLFYRQSIGITGVSFYFGKYSFLPSHRQKSNWKKKKICKKYILKKMLFLNNLATLEQVTVS